MKLSALAQLRLANQQISQHKFSTPAKLAAWLGGLQAQDPVAVRWALGVRLKGKTTEADLIQAVADKAVLRTWCMRGTIHLVAPQDARWLVALTADRPVAAAKRVHAALGIDAATLVKSNKLLARELKGSPPLERQVIYAMLDQAGISTTGQRGYYLLWNAGMQGLLCFGPPSGRQPTFVLLDEWAPSAGLLSREEAAAELARRYFRSRGPATLADWIWWSGLAPGTARAAHHAARNELEEVAIDGVSYWMAAARVKPKTDGFYLLPGFDEFVLGYKNRSAVLEPRFASGIAYSNGIFFPTMVSSGRILGTWKPTTKKGSLIVEPRPFESLSKKEKAALAGAAAGYARFLGLETVKVSV